MTIDIALEDIAIGEADLKTASRTIAICLKDLDDDNAHELYAALRSWLWKALDARRRDDELTGWLDTIGRVSAHLANRWEVLATKLDGFAELLQASIMVSAVPQRLQLIERKHVPEIVAAIYMAGGRLARKELVASLNLKDANLTRVAAPLQDAGWIQREIVGREVVYRLTEKGKEHWLPVVARLREPWVSQEKPHVELLEIHVRTWGVSTVPDLKKAHCPGDRVRRLREPQVTFKKLGQSGFNEQFLDRWTPSKKIGEERMLEILEQ